MRFDWDIVQETLPRMLDGLVITALISVWGMVLALVVGLLVAAAGLSRYRLLTAVAGLWLTLMRGVPLLVFMYWVYYGLPQASGVTLDSFTAAVLALGLTGSAYMAEVYRSGIAAVDPGQREAAAALGVPVLATFWRVVFPQAARLIIAPTINIYVGLLKGATIVSVIGVSDMLYVARQVSVQRFAPFELYTVAGLILIAITVVVALLGVAAERRLDRGRVRHA